jgi:DNA-binding protein
MAEDNVVFVGNKSPMNYVLAVITQFHNGAKKVDVKARGKAISRAVDVAEIVKNKFMDDVKVAGIDIGTEEIQSEKGGNLNVSTVSISLEKGKAEKKKK